MKTIMTITLLITILITSCAILPGTRAGDLEGTAWTLTTYNGKSLIQNSSMTAAFEDGEVSGSASCNHYFGAYQVQGDKIQVDGLGWTEMACMDPEGIMQQEQEIMSIFSQAETILIEGQIMQIMTSPGDTLIFQQVDTSP